MSQQKPVPRALRILRGNPREHALRADVKRDAYTSSELLAACPAHLSAERKRWWKYYAATFAPSNIITETDLVLLEQLCAATAERMDFDKKLEENGPLFKSPKSGYIMISPLYTLATAARDREYKLLREFGGSPSSRTNVIPVGSGSAENPWADVG